MSLLDIFKKSGKRGDSELDRALDAYIAIEARKDRANVSFERATKALENEYAKNIGNGDDTEPSAAEVAEAQHRLNAVERLLKEAETEAVGIIGKNQAEHRQRLKTVDADISETRSAIDLRKVKLLAEFCKKHDLRIQWPTKNTGGMIAIPALSLDSNEIQDVAGTVTMTPHRDPDAGKLDQLLKERTKLNVLISGTPGLALRSLVDERRRG